MGATQLMLPSSGHLLHSVLTRTTPRPGSKTYSNNLGGNHGVLSFRVPRFRPNILP
jgi:hypothetical protein